MHRLLTPHLHVKSVCELEPERLDRLGIDALLLDVDCTLKRYRERECGPDVTVWLDRLRKAGVGICLVSNGRSKRIRLLAGSLGLPYVASALKPLPFRLRAVVRRLGFSPARTAMVGDQVFADVLAGRLAGLTTILVEPIHPEEEPWLTQLKRHPERAWLRRLRGKVERGLSQFSCQRKWDCPLRRTQSPIPNP